MSTPREQLASMLKTARTEAGFDNHGALARAISMHRSVVSKAENPAQPTPSDALLIAWSGVTGCPLDQLADLAKRCRSGTPDWFTSYLVAESSATVLRTWAPLVVPGLLQTEEYARAVLRTGAYPADRLESLLETRMRRQEVLTRVRYTAVVDHLVFARCMGSPSVMADQCAHLVSMAEHSGIALHIVPEGVNAGMSGTLDIASHGQTVTVNMGQLRDIATTEDDMIESALALYERVLGASLSQAESVAFVREKESEWKTRT